jgi:hypothetical protein
VQDLNSSLRPFYILSPSIDRILKDKIEIHVSCCLLQERRARILRLKTIMGAVYEDPLLDLEQCRSFLKQWCEEMRLRDSK